MSRALMRSAIKLNYYCLLRNCFFGFPLHETVQEMKSLASLEETA